jgi:hypothetical protein
MERLIETPARLAFAESAERMSQKMAESAREAGGPPRPRISLRSVLAIPGIVMVLVLSRSFNLCAAVLFAYGTFLVSNPISLRLLAHTLRREKRAGPLPRGNGNGNGFVGSTDNVIGDEQSDEHDFNEMAVVRRYLDPVLRLRAPPTSGAARIDFRRSRPRGSNPEPVVYKTTALNRVRPARGLKTIDC